MAALIYGIFWLNFNTVALAIFIYINGNALLSPCVNRAGGKWCVADITQRLVASYFFFAFLSISLSTLSLILWIRQIHVVLISMQKTNKTKPNWQFPFDEDACLLHVWKGNSRRCPDLILRIFSRVHMRKLLYIYFSISLGSFFNVTTGNTPHTLNLPVHSFLFHTLFLSSQLSRNARMLTSFPLLLSEVREKRGEVWEEGGSWRLYWLCWGWKLFLFFSVGLPCLSLYIQQCLPCSHCCCGCCL